MADIVQNDDGQVRVGNISIQGSGGTYDEAASYQDVADDLTLGSGAGKGGGDTAYLSPVMGHLHGSNQSKAGNYLGGVIGAYDCEGTNASTYPTGAVLAQVTDGVTTAKGAVVAYIDGDSSQTNCGAMFKVMSNNSTAASGPDFGLDLQDAAHDGFQPVDAAFYKKAPVRIVGDVCLLVGSGNPVNGTTGAGTCGPGSLYFDTSVTTKAVYVNTNTKTSPTWTALY